MLVPLVEERFQTRGDTNVLHGGLHLQSPVAACFDGPSGLEVVNDESLSLHGSGMTWLDVALFA